MTFILAGNGDARAPPQEVSVGGIGPYDPGISLEIPGTSGVRVQPRSPHESLPGRSRGKYVSCAPTENLPGSAMPPAGGQPIPTENREKPGFRAAFRHMPEHIPMGIFEQNADTGRFLQRDFL